MFRGPAERSYLLFCFVVFYITADTFVCMAASFGGKLISLKVLFLFEAKFFKVVLN